MLHWTDLHNYQYGSVWKAVFNKRIALFLGLGLGKTIITLTVLVILKMLQRKPLRVLVVAPTKVAKTVWHKEAANWIHTKDLTFAICVGSVAQRIDAIAKGAEVTVINVENLHWLMERYPIDRRNQSDWPFDTVVLDESSLFKNNSSKRFKTFRKFTRSEYPKRDGSGLLKLNPPVKRVIELTATPASNGLTNLWSQMALLDNGASLGRSFKAFVNCYFYKEIGDTEHTKPRIKPGAKEKIYKKLAKLVHVLRTEDYLDMPEIIYNNIEVDLPTKVRRQYEELQSEFLLELDGGEEVLAPNMASLRQKLQQFCNGACYVGDPTDPDYKKEWVELHQAKLEKLDDLVDAAEGRENLVIGYWFKHDLTRLKLRYPNAVVLTNANVEEINDSWDRGEIPILLCQIQSAGHGLNLQHGGCTIIFFSMLWDLEIYDQFVGRIFRQGQKRGVTVNHIVVTASVEKRIAQCLGGKKVIQNDLLLSMSVME